MKKMLMLIAVVGVGCGGGTEEKAGTGQQACTLPGLSSSAAAVTSVPGNTQINGWLAANSAESQINWVWGGALQGGVPDFAPTAGASWPLLSVSGHSGGNMLGLTAQVVNTDGLAGWPHNKVGFCYSVDATQNAGGCMFFNPASGAAEFSGPVTIGGGTPVSKRLRGSIYLASPQRLAPVAGAEEGVVMLPGAADGADCRITPPPGTPTVFTTCYVAAGGCHIVVNNASNTIQSATPGTYSCVVENP